MKKFLIFLLSIILVSSSLSLTACGNNSKKYLGHRHDELYRGDFCEKCEAICWDSGEGYVIMELEIDSNQYFLLEVYDNIAFPILKENRVLYTGTQGGGHLYPNIKYIYVAPTVTTIPSYAFHACYELETIILSEGLKTIGYDAFAHCENLKKIDLPESLEIIGDSSFYGIPIKEISLGSNLVEIGKNAFADTKLASISIPNSVEKIGRGAFARSNIKNATIGKNVVYVGAYAFEECDKKLSIIFEAKENWFVKNDHYDHIDIAENVLSKKKEAGHLLLNKYCSYDWIRES